MNKDVLENLKKIIKEGRICPYTSRDEKRLYCTAYVDCECGYQGKFKDRTYRICKRGMDGLQDKVQQQIP